MKKIKQVKAIMAFAMTFCLMANPILAAMEDGLGEKTKTEQQRPTLPMENLEQQEGEQDDHSTGFEPSTIIDQQDMGIGLNENQIPEPIQEVSALVELTETVDSVASYELREEGTDLITISADEEGQLYASAINTTENAQDPSRSFKIDNDFRVSGTGRAIVIDTGVQMSLTLDSVSLGTTDMPAIWVKGNSILKLVLNNESTLNGGENFAAIQVERTEMDTAKIEITGTGVLTAKGGEQGAGVGSGYNGNAGQISIDVEGQINARGGVGAAGIGGGSSSYDYQENGHFGQSGDVTISGGTILAAGGDSGAGIGSGRNGFSNNIIISNAHVEANGGNSAAGIGSGDHGSAEYIEINSGDIIATGGASGAGIGSGLGSHVSTSKGVGAYYAHVVINDGTVEARGGSLAAGIGGGMYCDGVIEINGGIIDAKSGVEGQGKKYQGGAGIGGGYQGYAKVEINGATITAVGEHGAPGIGLGAVALQQKSETDILRNSNQHIKEGDNTIEINGGDINATGGMYAAAIGTGNSAIQCAIIIRGGNITAIGGENDNMGGAAIGTGVGAKAGQIDKDIKYATDTKSLTIEIGGNATIKYAKGGFGAAAIGAGYENATANEIVIKDNATIALAISTGEKFAIDTQRGQVSRADSTKVLQGTFMKQYSNAMVIEITEDKNPNSASGVVSPGQIVAGDLQLPASYRSFAATVGKVGSYLVRDSDGAYFVFNTNDSLKSETDIVDNATFTPHYATNAENLSDNYFLYEPKVKPVEPVPPVNPGVPDRPTDPVDVPDVDVPLTPPTIDPEVEEDIIEPEIPLIDAPTTEDTVIKEENVPLASLPKTGGTDITLALLGLAIVGCGINMKRKED